MPIRYYINSELGVILYVGIGTVTGTQYFEAAEKAFNDRCRKWGMVTVIDVLNADTDFELHDVRRAIELINRLPHGGLEPEQVVALTRSKGIRLISDTMKLMPSKVPIKFDVLAHISELIAFLGLSDREREFMSFYNECTSGVEPSEPGYSTISGPRSHT